MGDDVSTSNEAGIHIWCLGMGEINKNLESCNQNSEARSKWIKGLLSCVGTFPF